jgi:hypothetical protein
MATKTETFDSKVMLSRANEKKLKIRYTDRVKLEIIKETKHYKLGKIITPHRLVADELVRLDIAKVVKS